MFGINTLLLSIVVDSIITYVCVSNLSEPRERLTYINHGWICEMTEFEKKK